jgi:hypothetical protein
MALAMLSLVSELMGLVSNGPNGVLDTFRHLVDCVIKKIELALALHREPPPGSEAAVAAGFRD